MTFDYKKQNWIAYGLSFILFFLFFLIAYSAEGTYDPGDGIRHYQVSRYSWTNPDLLLYSWGKPFFTLVSSLFSQLGMMGIIVFNILCGLGSALFLYKIARHYKMDNAWLVVPFVLMAPVFFGTMNSGLTEPFFSLTLSLGTYLIVVKQKYAWSFVVVSCLPLIRTEGILILPVFGLIGLIERRFISVLLLGTCGFIYSVVGYFYFGDFFWIKNQNPYTGMNSDLYGKGDLLHFVNGYSEIFGDTLTLLLILGLLVLLIQFISKKIVTTKPDYAFILLIVVAPAVYFTAHSVFWWKGIVGSLGLIRVMGAITAPLAIIQLIGVNSILKVLPKLYKQVTTLLCLGLITFLVVKEPFTKWFYPYKIDGEQKVLVEVGKWFKNSEYKDRKVYFLYPYLGHVMDINPFDRSKTDELWSLYPNIKEWGYEYVPDGTIIIWDAHFGPNECRIPLERIMDDPYFNLIKVIEPETPLKTLGDYDFEVYIFEKVAPK